MNSGIYLTGLGKEFSSQEKSKDKNKENIELNEFKDKINLSCITEKNNEIILERSKHNIVDYLIREETNFSDLYKVEKYYKNLIVENSQKYDRTSALIDNKMKEIEFVQDLINREIIANIDLEKQDILDLYAIEKEKLHEKIDKFDHDNECYHHMLERIYYNNVISFNIFIRDVKKIHYFVFTCKFVCSIKLINIFREC